MTTASRVTLRKRTSIDDSRRSAAVITDVATLDKMGLKGFDADTVFGLYAPAGTPMEIVRKLHAAAAKGLSKQEVRDKIALGGMDAAPSASPEAFAAEIRAEAPGIEKSIRESGAKVE